MNKRLKTNRGVTMVEMMIVVVIIGIMASMSVPKFQKAYDRMKFKSANREITSKLRLARSKAITDKKYYGVYFDDVARTVTLFKKDPTDTLIGQFTASDEVISVDTLSQTLNYMATPLVDKAIVFKPNGGATFLGYTYVVSYTIKDDLVAIYVNHILASTGRVKGVGYYY